MSFFENTRKPVGFGGKIMVAMMNLGHSAVARWGLQFLNAAPDAKVMDCGCVILATPIYAWYCTPPMKALLDRLVYGMNKFYGREKGPSLWQGKAMALLMTCGYRPEKGCDLFEEGMRRYCKHSGLRYLGSHAERHLGYDTAFMDADKEARTRAFARELMGAV